MREEFAIFLLEGGGGDGDADVARAHRIASRLVEETDRRNPRYLELLGAATQRRDRGARALALYREALQRSEEIESASRTSLSRRLGKRIEKLEKELSSR